jgi:hypothetical protein
MRAKTYIYMFLIVFLLGGLYLVLQPSDDGDAPELLPAPKETQTITLWYTDAALTEYLNSAALTFYEREGVRVEPVLRSGLEYIEEINEASVRPVTELTAPDLYIAGADSLEKAAMAGLVRRPEDPEHIDKPTYAILDTIIRAIGSYGLNHSCYYFECADPVLYPTLEALRFTVKDGMAKSDLSKILNHSHD